MLPGRRVASQESGSRRTVPLPFASSKGSIDYRRYPKRLIAVENCFPPFATSGLSFLITKYNHVSWCRKSKSQLLVPSAFMS